MGRQRQRQEQRRAEEAQGEHPRYAPSRYTVALIACIASMYWSLGMWEVAARARASKETLYSWFDDKRGLFEELVAWQAEGVDEALGSSLERDADDTGSVLREFAVELIRLVLGERSVFINRAAISEASADPTFARLLSAKGRGSIVPKLARYLESQRERGHLEFADAGPPPTLSST